MKCALMVAFAMVSVAWALIAFAWAHSLNHAYNDFLPSWHRGLVRSFATIYQSSFLIVYEREIDTFRLPPAEIDALMRAASKRMDDRCVGFRFVFGDTPLYGPVSAHWVSETHPMK